MGVKIRADPFAGEGCDLVRHGIADPQPACELAGYRRKPVGQTLGGGQIEKALTGKPLGAGAGARACGEVKKGRTVVRHPR